MILALKPLLSMNLSASSPVSLSGAISQLQTCVSLFTVRLGLYQRLHSSPGNRLHGSCCGTLSFTGSPVALNTSTSACLMHAWTVSAASRSNSDEALTTDCRCVTAMAMAAAGSSSVLSQASLPRRISRFGDMNTPVKSDAMGCTANRVSLLAECERLRGHPLYTRSAASNLAPHLSRTRQRYPD